MDLTTTVINAHAALDKYQQSHPNLVSLWRGRIVTLTQELNRTVTQLHRATDLFELEPDPPIETLSLLLVLLQTPNRYKD